jgi:hypothetical protein
LALFINIQGKMFNIFINKGGKRRMNEYKEIDLNRTLYDLTEEYPELIPILQEAGLSGAANSVMRKTAGRTVKLIEGIQRHKLSLEEVVERLEKAGYSIKPLEL